MDFMHGLRVIFGLLALFVLVPVVAQQPSYVQYTLSDGLPSNTVYYSIQDREGYIWLATDRGVARFNGRNVVTFSFRDGLSENEVFDLFQDSQGRIWFSGFNGMPCYYYQGKFYGREIMPVTSRFENSSIGLKILEDRNGSIFYCTREAFYQIEESSVREIRSDKVLNSTLCYDQDSAVYLLSTSKDSVYVSNLTTGEITLVPRTPYEVAPRQNTKAVLVRDQLYFSAGNELAAIDLTQKSLRIVLKFESAELLQSVQRRNENSFWLGTKDGLYIFDVETERLERQLFPSVSVSSATTDSEGNLWITSLNKGVYQVISEDVELMDSQSGIDFSNCQYLAVLDSNEIVIGSKGFKCAFIRDGRVTNITLPQGMGEGKIQSVKKDLQGNICIATGISYCRLHPDYSLFETYLAAVSDVYFLADRTIYAQGDRILVVTEKSLEARDVLLDAYIHSSSPIALKAKKISMTRDSTLYATGIFGVRKIEGRSVEKLTDHVLLNTNIVDFAETPDGLQWFASSLNGVIVKRGEELLQLSTANGLTSDFITCLAVSPEGELWVGTQGGLSRISYDLTRNDYEVKSYGKTDGLVSEQVNDIVFFRNELWVATDLGTCVFDPHREQESGAAPKLVIESVLLNGKEAAVGDVYELPYNETSIKLTYIGISLSSLDNVRYLYRIGGDGAEWVETSGTSLEYPSLPVGEHLFEIKAIGSNGEISVPTQIRFFVAPAFYQTSWFLLLLIAFVAAVVFLVIHWRIQKLNKDHELAQYLLRLENEKLETENKVVAFNRNMAELEQKALMLHMNPHFIFNSINAINGFYASGDSENAKIYVNMFSKLLRSILDFSQKKLVLLRDEVELLHNYLRLNQLRFNHKFAYAIQLDENVNANTQLIPPMIIQPFVENAIIHGIAARESSGEIQVFLFIQDSFLVCEITDNGIGLTESARRNKSRIHDSTGIKISRERIQLFAGGLTDALEISEQNGPDGQVTGTRVRFKLHLENLW